ncbi:hypothetical protein FHX81_4274 [Saccharothrix saharensis]|uniref:Uncharacterized protein n=1 Tax=Saccharothrix saharensis TaxID=571190 RepID=A0A543JGB5_9PSEU|nr:hypothetical protein [Saccharothrix saharensis]TQM81888.1 hypothetical protein FHX81_4274 [Saccharothrix saharensis]
MSWQEDLQELDNALASGKITADEYRVRRDQVLANASGPQPQQPPSPFPEPFKWNSGPDATQVVQPGQADRTQVVRPDVPQQQPGDADRTQYVQPVAVPRPDVDRTQVVPQGPTSGGFPAQPQPDWSGGASTPPWGGGDFGGGSPWGTAGPEVFEEESGGKGRIIAVVLVVVLVVGLGFGAYMIWGRGSGTTGAGGTSSQTPSTTTVTTTTPPKRTPDGPFVEVPGKLSQFKTLSIEDALAAKLPTLEEAQLVQSGGATEVRYVVSRDEATKLVQGIWAFQTDRPDALLSTVDNLYAAANFQVVPGAPTGVIARNLALTPQNPTAIYRAHYAVDDFVVRVEAYGPDEAAAKAAFDELLARQLEEHPPTS